MDSPRLFVGIIVPAGLMWCGVSAINRKESDMNINAASLSVAVDLSKSVFQLAVVDSNWRIIETHRLTRTQFERWFVNRLVGLVIMEACGSAHHWARWLALLGVEVKLLPAKYVRAYVKRNKTDAADAAALLEAARASDIVPVRVKSIEQQALQGLHRTRSLWMGTRTSRINALRGFCREFGIAIAQGSRVGVEQISRVLADPTSAVPTLIRGTLRLLVEEIRLLEARIAQLERELTSVARQSAACATLLSIPGVGLLTATAMVAATGGQVNHFRNARHFASWFGLTPKEYSSGSTRSLGRISKRGDRYLRMLLTHGARSVLRAATVARNAAKPLDPLRAWALNVQGRSNHNKAACALANKMARICYATLRDAEPYGHVARREKKIARTAFEMPT
jgi:transposase